MSSVSSTSSSMEMVCSSPAKSLSSLRMARKETRRRPRQSRLKANASRANVRQEEHAVTLLSLSHRHARTVPEPLRHFRFLIVVVPARTQRRSELVLVFRQPLNHNGGDALIHAKIRPAPSRVLFRKLSHHLQTLLRRCFRRTKTTRDEIPSVVSPVPALVLLAPKRPRLRASRLVLLFVHPAHRPHRRHTPSSLSHSRALTPSLSSSRARVVVISPIHSEPLSSHPSSRARALGRSRARSFGPSRRSRRTGRRANVRAASRLRSRASHRRRHRRRRRRPHRSHRHRDVKGSGARGRDAGGRARRAERRKRGSRDVRVSLETIQVEKKMTMSVEPAMVDVATRARRHSSRAQSRARNRAPDEPTESNPSLQRALCADGG